jgi:hypothetical protein
MRRELAEPQIVIETREELHSLLSQTPWLEHMVMLAYLFASFRLKTEVSEGLTEEQLEAVNGWNAALAQGGGDQERPQENVGAPAPEFLTPFRHHRERNTVQHTARQRKETRGSVTGRLEARRRTPRR